MKQVSILKQISDRTECFRELCTLYSDFVSAEGIFVKPYSTYDLPHFSARSAEDQDKAIASIANDLEIFESMRAEGHSLLDSPKLLWRSMSRMGLVPQSDVFDKIGKGDAIEIYLADQHGQHQVFRNILYLQYCSYTVEQMVALDWRFSAVRDETYSRQITEAAMGILTGKFSQTFDPAIDAHIVREVDSPGLNEVKIKIKYLSPVRKHGDVVGALVVMEVELLRSTRISSISASVENQLH